MKEAAVLVGPGCLAFLFLSLVCVGVLSWIAAAAADAMCVMLDAATTSSLLQLQLPLLLLLYIVAANEQLCVFLSTPTHTNDCSLFPLCSPRFGVAPAITDAPNNRCSNCT
jgi:hypothetical protein